MLDMSYLGKEFPEFIFEVDRSKIKELCLAIGDENPIFLNKEEAQKAVAIYRERFAPIGIFENKIYNGIIDMLENLKKAGKTLAVSTSKPTVFAERIIEKFGMKPYFCAVCGSELDGRNTDKALVIKNTMETLGATNKNTVMVGDRIHDCIGAEKNSIPFVGVTYGYAKEGEFKKNTAFDLVNSPKELCDILLSM